MSEPEEVLIDAARYATTRVGRLWRRREGDDEDPAVRLETLRRRLSLLISALHGLELPLRIAQPPASPGLLRRLLERRPRALRHQIALPGTDGHSLFLPARLEDDEALSGERWYRVLALQQAARALRGSAGLAELPLAGLSHELYLLSEAGAAERTLARTLPGLSEDLRRARAAALAARPPLELLEPPEKIVETLYRELLADPATGPPAAADPETSLRWACARANELETGSEGRYRGLLRDLWLGQLLPPPAAPGRLELESGTDHPAPKAARLPRRPQARQAGEDEDDQEPGMWMLQMDDPHEHVEDPMGMQRPLDRGAGDDSEGAADSLSELEEARLVATPERAAEVFVSDSPPDALAYAEDSGPRLGIRYPEWDYRIQAYRPAGATVWVRRPALGDPAWAAGVMARRRRQFEEVKRRFEGLRPRRMTFHRQRDGEEVDLDAYVDGLADLRAGQPFPEDLYSTTRPARRDVAILLLIDISGSTDAWVGESLRIIDVEKEALLLCCQALDGLGDPYSIQAFSGEGPHGVMVWPVKDFSERDAGGVSRRIAALEPQSHTRAGAAMRHATASLAARCEQHRLLLLLSDGKPNDVDQYEGHYGIEDMRQAVTESRAAGVHCFCLTVDRDAPSYLSRIFGPRQHAVLRHPRELPTALVEVLRLLLQQ